MKLYSWGANNYGQLGLGYICEQSNTPLEVPENELMHNNIKFIKGGGGHTLVLDDDENVYSCGLNSSHQLGYSEYGHNVPQFKRIKCLDRHKISQISCGWESSFAITEEGCVLVWGSNKYGQLGISDKNKMIKEPTLLELSGVVQISSGLRHTAVLLDNGQVMITGQGRKGQLGIKKDDNPVTQTDNFQKVPCLENVKIIACGQNHSMALTYDGKLYAWGDNKHGQLGGDPRVADAIYSPVLIESLADYFYNNNIINMQAGWTHSVFLSENGTVITYGRNSYGQLGIPEEKRVSNWIPQVIPLNKGITQLSVGSEHNIVSSDDGELISWGWNEHGNCGTGNIANILMPTKLHIGNKVILIGTGSAHSFALVEN